VTVHNLSPIIASHWLEVWITVITDCGL